MSRTHAQIMAALDPLDEASITALLDFHRVTFGDARMEGEDDAEAQAADEEAARAAAETGYPKDTPLAEMTAEQQVAYWKHQARKHEGVVKGLGNIDELKAKAAKADELEAAKLSDEEKAVATAREEGRQAALAELRPRLVESAFRSVAGQRQLPAEQTDTLWQGVNPQAFLTDTGEVDTDKVTRYLGAITPVEDPKAGLYNTGGGQRDLIKQTDREAGLAEAQKRFGAKS